MVIPHFRKGQVMGRLRCWGSQNLSKRNRPYRESSTKVVPMAQMTVISKGWERRVYPLLAQSGHSTTEFQRPLLGAKRTSAGYLYLQRFLKRPGANSA